MSAAPTSGTRAVGLSCPICRNTAPVFFASGRDRLFGLAAGRFPLYRCPACRCIFQHPRPRPEALPSYYPDGYWWAARSAAKKSFGLLDRLERIYRESVVLGHVRFLERCARDSAGRRLLDIGCGSGTFLYQAGRRGFVPFGMDLSSQAVAAAREQYGLTVRQGGIGSPIWGEARFDFVTMFHLLEHLPEPGRALGYASGLLAPGGSLILQVPNVDSIQARLFGGRWYGLDVPRHVTNFGPKALRLLLEENGFAVLRTGRFSMRDNPAALASSLAPGLDPIGRRGRRRGSSAAAELALEFLYLGLFVFSIPAALAESALGRGATLWVQAKRKAFSIEDGGGCG